MLRFIWKNAWRSKRRTVLTVLSLTATLFLLSSMLCVLSSGKVQLARAEKSSRMVVRHAAGLTHSLPLAYKQKIRDVPHVQTVHWSCWFGGLIPDREDVFFANFATDVDTMEEMWDEYTFDPGVIDKLKGELRGAIVSRALLETLKKQTAGSWDLGKTVTLHSPIYNIDLEFVILGTAQGPDESAMFFRYDYLEKMRGDPGEVGMYWIRADDAANIPGVINDVDRMFANSEYETKTETEKAFLEGFNSMMGNIRDLVLNISLAIVIMLLMVTVNTMAMAARERTTEHAVMRCLGFSRGRITALFVGESLLISMIGAVLGVGGAVVVYRPGLLDLRAFWPDFYMVPATIAIGLGVALVIGLLAGLLPSLGASRRSIVDGLRRVD